MRYEVSIRGPHGNLVLSTFESTPAEGEFWVTAVDGWFGGVGVESDDSQRKIGHGFLSAPARRSARTITLKGALLMPGMEAREVAARFVSGLTWDGSLGELTVAREGLELTAQVRLDGAIKTELMGDSAVAFEAPFVAPDPFLYATPKIVQLFPAGAGTGLRYPLFGVTPKGVLSYGDTPPQAAIIQHNGNAAAHPVYVVRGDWASGFRLTSSGRVLEFPHAVNATAPVTIDCATGALYLSGQDQTHLLTRRAWHTAQPNSGFEIAVEALAPASGWVDVNFSDTYI